MTAQDLKTRFPNEDEALIDSVFPLISGSIGCYFGGSFNNSCDREPMLFLAMHLIKVEDMANSSTSLREVTSKAVDGVSVSYSSSGSSGGDIGFFSSTKYGRQFESILANSGIGAVFV